MIGEFFIISRRINKKIKSVFTDKSDKILDLGCGSNPKYHKSINGRIVCFDKTESKITNVVGDANNLPFKANSFDKIISVNSFYYFNNPFKVIKDIHISLFLIHLKHKASAIKNVTSSINIGIYHHSNLK